MTVVLQRELQTYQAKLPEMLASHNGEFVVIREDQPFRYFSTYAEALIWAYDEYEFEKFFVKKVAEDEAVAHFTRDLGPCRL